MPETKLDKPRAIQAFEKRFKIEAGRCQDVFYLRLASSWQDFFRSAFCFFNDAGVQEREVAKVTDPVISLQRVAFEGSLVFCQVWGSDCLL
ncbi:MAG: hypothetical protein HY454_02265, partial [Parcubacteria group bacterium]|nr:hypothetical protein [Parcubacteria group bacterium]